jgi:hypothetical protein
LCIPPPKILPRARIHPEKARPPGTVSEQVRVGLTGPVTAALTSALGLVVTCQPRPGPRRGQTPRPYINVAHPIQSGRGDLNSRSLVPQTSALTKLGHVPPRHGVASDGTYPPGLAGSVSLAQPRGRPKRKLAQSNRPAPLRRPAVDFPAAAVSQCPRGAIPVGGESYDVAGMARAPRSL